MTIKPSMNTCDGWLKVAALRFVGVLLLISCVAACGGGGAESATATIEVSQPGSVDIDIDLVVANTHAEVEKLLPNSHLRYVSIAAECADLGLLRGMVTLEFVQVRATIFGERVMIARAKVDTEQQGVQIQTRDETEYYPSTELLVLDGLPLRDIAQKLQNHLSAQGRCGGTVVLARTNTNGTWGVRCGPPDKVFIECLEIDPTTGEITELR